MRILTFLPLFVLLCLSLRAQKPYFQQELHYTIVATLHDTSHTLTGRVEFEYINHSPDVLPEIWVHLWGNAFKNRKSAFARQKLRSGSSRYYFADESELGYFRQLDFSADGQKATWAFDPKNPDIARIVLPTPLAPGARVHIATPFLLKIPASFSRLGHVGSSYQMTQWYPKPAVYDHKGWHPMPYLDQGEFYSDFGSFDVTLTLPDNYVVGATGTLQTPSEREFLQKKEVESRQTLFAPTTPQTTDKPKKGKVKAPFPPSSTTQKTIRYTASQVHDFAWFADKRFYVLKDTAHLNSGKAVDCWAMFTAEQAEQWKRGAFYVRRALEFYSDKVGEYPWPQATAVHSALSAGGGMEYPMITVIGNSEGPEDLDEVITHEVGHNWFYGILASNERDHPFMDEGLNSYYETRYMQQYYNHYEPVTLPDILYNARRNGDIIQNGYLLLARNHKDTPPDTPSDHFTPYAYGLQVYMKTAMTLKWLEQSIGTARFDSAMQHYYQQWKFRHPYPEDLRASWLQSGLTEQQIGWWFEAMQTQKQADFKITEVEKNNSHHEAITTTPPPPAGSWKIEVKNKGTLQAPFSITALQGDKPLLTRWYTQPGEITFPAVDADRFVADYEQVALDLQRKNNSRSSSGFMPGLLPMEFRPLAAFQSIRHTTIALLPWLGWNNIDKTMIGAAIYSPPFPPRRFQYYLLPGYALGSRRFVGSAHLEYKIYPGGVCPKITFGLSSKTYDYDYNPKWDYYTKFWKVAPQVRADLRTGSNTFSHALAFRTLFISRERDTYSIEGEFLGKTWHHNTIYELRYEGEERMLPNPFRFKAALETQAYLDGLRRPANYLRGTAEWVQKFYYKPGRKVTARLFAGAFLSTTQRNRLIEETALTLNPQGFNDYRFDYTFIARSGGAGILGRQVSQSDGGFKAAFGSPYATQTGNSNNYVLALNLRADLPKRLPLGLPLRPYFDIGYFNDATLLGASRPASEQWLWSGGLLLEFFRGRLELYMPLANSKELKRLYCEQAGGSNSSAIFCGGNYLKMLSWSVNLTLGDPTEALLKMVE